MAETYVPSVEEFQCSVRTEFGFLIENFGYQETRIDVVKYFNPCSVRYQSRAAIVVVSGIGHGYNTSVTLIDPVAEHREIEQGLPLWPVLAIRAPALLDELYSTSGQLRQLPLLARGLLANGTDILEGDFSIRERAMQLVEAAIEEQRDRETANRLRDACFRANEEFRKANYSRVVEILSEHENVLGKTDARKLDYARSKLRQ